MRASAPYVRHAARVAAGGLLFSLAALPSPAQARPPTRAVPDSTAEGRALGCVWRTRERMAITFSGADSLPQLADPGRREAALAYVDRLTRALDEFFAPDDTIGALRQAVAQAALPAGGDARVLVPSGSSQFDRSVVSALQLALRIEELDPGPPWLGGATILAHAGRPPQSSDTAATRFRACPVRPAGGPQPKYPEELRTAGIEGEVRAEFLVDTTGRADLRTFRVVNAGAPTHQRFVDAVHAVLPAMRFHPATRDGRKIRQLVRQPVKFRLED